MAKNYNIGPYYDDFDVAKRFYRILFNPSRAVQARELTQLQTIFSNQFEKFANRIFADGSIVTGADIKINTDVVSLAVDVGANQLSDFDQKYIRGVTDSSASAFVHRVANIGGQDYLYCIMRGGEFVDTDTVTTEDVDNIGDPIISVTDIVSVGNAVFASVDPGVVYADGTFIDVLEQQNILVDGTGNTGNYFIGFDYIEEEITSDDDSSLLSPAQGTSNVNAPGADRYRVTLTLAAYNDTDNLVPTDGTFYQQQVFTSGELAQQRPTPDYSDILDLLAQRTDEESGNYTVDPFLIALKDHPTDSTKFIASMDPGIAYINGYRNEKLVKTDLEINKARTFRSNNVETRYIDYGPYVVLDPTDGGNGSGTSYPDVFKLPVVTFYSIGSASQSAVYVLGTARATALVNTGTEIRLYITDLSSVKSKISSAKSVAIGTWEGDLLLEPDPNPLNPNHAFLYAAAANDTFIFPLKEEAVRTVNDTNVIYNYQALQSSQPTSSDWDIVVTSPLEIDAAFRPTVFRQAGGIGIEGTDYTYSVSGDLSTISFTSINDMGVCDIIYGVERTGSSARTKTVTTIANELQTTNDYGVLTLAEEDVIEIVSIVGNPTGWTLDNGARDTHYTNGTISGLAPGTQYDITYTYYAHTGSTEYFHADSYSDYEDIPTYTNTNGVTYNLRDCFDFRRKLSEYSSSRNPITPARNMTVDYDFYLPRWDLLEIDQYGNFRVKEGINSLEGVPPIADDDAMALYEIGISAYTFNLGDVQQNYIENKRYTMRDIGKLEKRINDVEYYSSLNLLEKELDSLEIEDSNGLSRFKNGILVDNFIGSNVADVFDPTYFAAMDTEAGMLRPYFTPNQLQLEYDAANSSNVTVHDSTITLPYSEVVLIDQPLASGVINVNPYNVFNWQGDCKLIPASDNWIDTVWLPDLVTNIDGLYDSYIQATIAAYGTQWGSWRTIWTGVVVEQTRERRDRSGSRIRDVTTTTTTRIQIRTGTRLVARPNRITKNVGSRVVDVSVIPYMRHRKIKFRIKNMKPNTLVKMYFDNVDVGDKLCLPDAGYEITTAERDAGWACKTDAQGKLNGTFWLPRSSGNVDYPNFAGAGQGPPTVPTYSTTERALRRFRSGTKRIHWIDDVNNPGTEASCDFQAQGHKQKKQRSILSIDSPILTTVTVQDDRTTTEVDQEFSRWYDPIAQTILIDDEGGAFITSIDIFFASKDANLPVSIQVVETLNGIPGGLALPYSQVSLEPASVNVDAVDGSVATTFTFTDPVYLQQGVEYAFIVYSNSDNYEIWYAEIGAFDVAQLPNEVRIAEQPYTGVMLKSQNGSTWTPDQTKDVKFQIKRAKFQTLTGDSTTGTARFVHDDSTGDDQVIAWEQNLAAEDAMWCTHAQFEHDHLTFELTDLQFDSQFEDIDGSVLFYPFTNGEIIGFSDQVEIKRDYADTKRVRTRATFYTELDTVSPVLHLERNQCIVANNLIVDRETPQRFYQESTQKGNATYDFIACTYVTKSTNLATPADDLKVLLDINRPSGSEVNVFFSTGKFNPQFVEIYDGDTVLTAGESITASENLIKQNMYLYDWDTSVASPTNNNTRLSEFICTDVNTGYDYLRTVGGWDVNTMISSAYIQGGTSGATALITSIEPDGAEFIIYVKDVEGTFATSELLEETIGRGGTLTGNTTSNDATTALFENNIGRIYLTGIENPDDFHRQVDWTANLGASHALFATPLDMGATSSIDEWAAGTYNLDDIVFHNRKIYQVVVASTTAAPASNSTDWAEYDYNFLTGNTHDNTIVEDEQVVYKRMEVESQLGSDADATTGFVEYTFVPATAIEEEFSNFKILIQMTARNPVDIPMCSALRAIATY